MINELKMFGCTCDNCGKQWVDYNGIMAFAEELTIRDNITDDEWYKTDEGQTYCPDCFDIDDNDELTIINKQ